MRVKINGIWEGVFQVIHAIIQHFKEKEAIKLGTVHHSSPEFYLVAREYDVSKRGHVIRTHCLVNSLTETTYAAYLESKRIIIHKGCRPKSLDSYDWYEPIDKFGVIRVLDSRNTSRSSRTPPTRVAECYQAKLHGDGLPYFNKR